MRIRRLAGVTVRSQARVEASMEVKVRKVMVSMGEERDRGSMNKRGVGWEFER